MARAALERAATSASWPYPITDFGATDADREALAKAAARASSSAHTEAMDAVSQQMSQIQLELERMRQEIRRGTADLEELVRREVEQRLGGANDASTTDKDSAVLARLLGETVARYAVEDRGPALARASPAAGAMYARVRLRLTEVLLEHKVLASGLVQGVRSLKVKLLVGAVELVDGRLLGALMEGAVRWVGSHVYHAAAAAAAPASAGVDFAAKGQAAARAPDNLHRSYSRSLAACRLATHQLITSRHLECTSFSPRLRRVWLHGTTPCVPEDDAL